MGPEGGHPWADHRPILNGLFWKLRSGAPWRDIPERYGPWSTIYDRYRTWCQEGRLVCILVAVRDTLDAQGLRDWEQWWVDSSNIRASRAAAGARKKGGLTTNQPTMRLDAHAAGSGVRACQEITLTDRAVRAIMRRMDTDIGLAEKFATILPHLNERQRRLLVAAAARALGRGGISRVARASGISRPTIQTALRELDQPAPIPNRVRRSGGGRKPARATDPTLLADLEALVEPTTRGDPMSPLRWTCKSTRQLAEALKGRGHSVSHQLVAALLRAAGYSLQAPVKTLDGTHHPDRNAQFRYLNDQITIYLSRQLPVISVDTKKKELVGAFKHGGREWQPKGQPEPVNVHDFPDPEVGKAIPYGIYDIGRNAGWVTVGQDHDTASFAVASLRRSQRS